MVSLINFKEKVDNSIFRTEGHSFKGSELVKSLSKK
jgi:hypothetical protein